MSTKIFAIGFWFIIVAPISLCTQELAVFDPLMNKTWKAEGQWGDGSTFKQEVHFKYDLNNQIVIAESKGFIDADKTQYGPRNHGIRQFNASTGKIHFWEFDVFGGATEGIVKSAGKDIIYTYDYQGTQVTDYWEYVDEYTYRFTVGIFENGQWQNKFISTEFKAEIPLSHYFEKLAGQWTSPAWDGILKENWAIGEDAKMLQSQEYWENGKMTYSAKSTIQEIDGEIVLISIIKDAAPKIFQATSRTFDEIIFENKDYTNPNQVIYQFSADRFTRTINGTENDEPVSYTFEFSSDTH